MLILSESYNYLDEKKEVCEGKLKVINKLFGPTAWLGWWKALRQRQWGPFPVDMELVFVFFFAQEELYLLIKQRIYWPGCQGQTSLETTGPNCPLQRATYIQPTVCCKPSKFSWVFHSLPALEAAPGIAPLAEKTAKLSLPSLQILTRSQSSWRLTQSSAGRHKHLGERSSCVRAWCKCKANRNEWKTPTCLESGNLDKTVRTEALCLTFGRTLALGSKHAWGREVGLAEHCSPWEDTDCHVLLK